MGIWAQPPVVWVCRQDTCVVSTLTATLPGGVNTHISTVNTQMRQEAMLMFIQTRCLPGRLHMLILYLECGRLWQKQHQHRSDRAQARYEEGWTCCTTAQALWHCCFVSWKVTIEHLEYGRVQAMCQVAPHHTTTKHTVHQAGSRFESWPRGDSRRLTSTS